MNKVIYLIIIICFLDLFIQLPIITPFAISLGASTYIAGVIVGVYSLFNMFGNVFGGYFADKIGRKKLLIVGMVIQIFILLMYTIVTSVELLIAMRVVHGLSSGLLTPAAFSLVSDISKKSRIGQSMALTGVAIGLSAVIGPAIGGILSSVYSYEAVYLFTAIIFMIGLLLIIFLVRESSTKESRQGHYKTSYWAVLKRPALIIAYISAFTLMISNGSLAFGLPLKTNILELSDSATGLMLSVYGITAIIVFASPLKYIYSRFNPVHLVIVGIITISVSMTLLNFVPTTTLTYIMMILYGLGFSLVFPSMNQIIAEHTELHDRGKANGLFYGFFSLGTVFGSYVSGIITTYYALPFFAIGVILILFVSAMCFINKHLEV